MKTTKPHVRPVHDVDRPGPAQPVSRRRAGLRAAAAGATVAAGLVMATGAAPLLLARIANNHNETLVRTREGTAGT